MHKIKPISFFPREHAPVPPNRLTALNAHYLRPLFVVAMGIDIFKLLLP